MQYAFWYACIILRELEFERANPHHAKSGLITRITQVIRFLAKMDMNFKDS